MNSGSIKTHRVKRPALVFLASCLVLVFAVTVVAAVKNDWFGWTRPEKNMWSRGMDSKLGGSNEQWNQLIEKGLVRDLISEGEESVTINGVTITPNIAVTDGVVGYVSFIVTGYEPDDGIPEFQGKGDIGFAEHAGQMVFEGFFRDSAADIFSEGYEGTDGELEYIQKCKKGFGDYFDPIFGLTLHADFRNLSTVHKEIVKDQEGHYTNVAEGVWTFNVKLPEGAGITDVSREISLDEELGDSGICIKSVFITPLSVTVFYESEEDARSLHPEVVEVDGNSECVGEMDYIWLDGGNQSRMYAKKIIDSDSVETLSFQVAEHNGVSNGHIYEISIQGGEDE